MPQAWIRVGELAINGSNQVSVTFQILERKSLPSDAFTKIRIGEVLSPSEFYIFNQENESLFKQICSILDEKSDYTVVSGNFFNASP